MSSSPAPSPSRPDRAPTPWNDGLTETPEFDISPVPPNPLGEGRYIRTAAALIIGCVLPRAPMWCDGR